MLKIGGLYKTKKGVIFRELHTLKHVDVIPNIDVLCFLNETLERTVFKIDINNTFQFGNLDLFLFKNKIIFDNIYANSEPELYYKLLIED